MKRPPFPLLRREPNRPKYRAYFAIRRSENFNVPMHQRTDSPRRETREKERRETASHVATAACNAKNTEESY